MKNKTASTKTQNYKNQNAFQVKLKNYNNQNALQFAQKVNDNYQNAFRENSEMHSGS